MDIFLIQHNCEYQNLVVIIDTIVYVYKYEKGKFGPPILSFQADKIFIGKSRVCPTTQFSGAADNSSDFDSNTAFLEFENNEYIYISGFEISKLKTDDKNKNYISPMGNNMIPYAIMVGEKYTYFLYHRYKFIENNKIEEGTLLNATDRSLDPFDYHLEKCGIDSCKKLEYSLIHTCWPGHGEDIENEDDDFVGEDIVEEDKNLIETPYLNGNNEVVKTFSQKCVLCYEKDSVYAFRQCGHQYICEQCYQNIADIDILKYVVCRT